MATGRGLDYIQWLVFSSHRLLDRRRFDRHLLDHDLDHFCRDRRLDRGR